MASAAAAARGLVPWRRHPRASTHASASSSASRVSRVDNAQPDTKGEALASWLRTHDGFEDLGVAVRWMGEARGFAGVAARGVEEGDVLVRVPHSAMLTAEDARVCPVVGDVASRVPDTAALALKLLAEKDAGRGSAWSPWIATLPTWEQTQATHPLAWSRERRERVLRGSPTLARLESMVASCREDFDALAVACGDAGTPPPKLEDVTWARAMISSRAFYLESDDGDGYGDEWWDEEEDEDEEEEEEEDGEWPDPSELDPGLDDDDEFEAFGGVDDAPIDDTYRRTGAFVALVPWADALNHSPGADGRSVLASTTDSNGVQCAELRASSAYLPGDEVHDSYGVGLTRQDTFLRYGFVEVSDMMGCEDSVDVAGTEFLAELRKSRRDPSGLGSEDTLNSTTRLDRAGLGPSETSVNVTGGGVGESALAWCEAVAAEVRGVDDGEDLGEACVAALARTCESMLSNYPEHILPGAHAAGGEECACGEDAAALVLASEARALMGFVKWANQGGKPRRR